MRFDVVTIFPGMFAPVFEQGVVGRAIERGLIELHAHDLRDHTHDRHRQVDDMPFGGGPGMVIKPEPVFEAVESIKTSNPGPVCSFRSFARIRTTAAKCFITHPPRRVPHRSAQ